jgi:cyanobactin maturation PatA/PatG family protease
VSTEFTRPPLLDAAESIGAADIWSETVGDPDVCVALLDGSVDTTHPSLAAADIRHVATPPFRLTAGDSWSLRHGTHIASVLFGQHGTAVAGIVPSCRGLVVPIFQDVQGRPATVSQLDLARAVLYALEQGALIINISGGQPDPSGRPEPVLADALRECERSGVLVVAATGNDGGDVLHVPAASANVLAVGATDAEGRLLPLSNWGAQYAAHGVLAPGENLAGARPGGGVAPGTGTSYAAAVVAGAAALLLSAERRRGLGPSPRAVGRAIGLGARPGGVGGEQTSAGRGTRARRGRLSINGARAFLSEGVGEVVDPVAAPGVHASGTDEVINAEFSLLEPEPDDLPVVAGTTPAELVPTTPAGPAGTCATCGDPASAMAGPQQPQLVYVIGQPGFDLVGETRRQSLSQHMGADHHPDNPAHVLDYFETNPWESEAVEWTLNLGATPVYALRPAGAFAREGYERLRQGVREHLDGSIERVSVAGMIVGQTQLMSGQVVPIVQPEMRCSYSWTTGALVEAVAGAAPDDSADQDVRAAYTARTDAVGNFLERAYEDFRNLGLTAAERALNFAATNALTTYRVFAAALRRDMQLDVVGVERSPICPPGSDCWDVNLTFFNPAHQLEQARRVYKFTVDVADVCPVMVGNVRNWAIR